MDYICRRCLLIFISKEENTECPNCSSKHKCIKEDKENMTSGKKRHACMDDYKEYIKHQKKYL